MLRLFEKDRDYGQGMEFKAIAPLNLDDKAIQQLSERGHVLVVHQLVVDSEITEKMPADLSMPTRKPIEYQAVYSNGILAGAYIV